MAVCENCGNEFYRPKKSKRRFCCHECRLEGIAKQNAAKPNMCAWCGKKFTGTGKFCGKECETKSYRVNNGSHNLYSPNLGKKVEK